MDRELAEQLIRHALPEHATVVLPFLRPSRRLFAEPVQQIPRASVSHFGGEPGLPPDVQWPIWDKSEYLRSMVASAEARHKDRRDQGRNVGEYAAKELAGLHAELENPHVPLSFIAQIALDESTPAQTGLPLPTSGSLCFFYDIDSMPWGFDPACRGGWQIVHVQSEHGELSPRTPPKPPTDWTIKPAHVRVEPGFCIPADLREETGFANLWRHDNPAYEQLCCDLQDSEGQVVHRIGGWPEEIQGDMRVTCQLASNGVYCGDSSVNQDPRVPGLAAGVKDWRLLLQIDSDDSIGVMWGDVGRIYYWMREDDITNRRWERAWFDLQCY